MNREQTTIRLPTDMKERLQREADEKGISFNDVLIIYLRKGIEIG